MMLGGTYVLYGVSFAVAFASFVVGRYLAGSAFGVRERVAPFGEAPPSGFEGARPGARRAKHGRRYGTFASSTVGARHISSRVVSPSWTVCGCVSPCSSSDAASLGLSSVLSYVQRMVMTSPGETAGS
jgi:hypothetical protein